MDNTFIYIDCYQIQLNYWGTQFQYSGSKGLYPRIASRKYDHISQIHWTNTAEENNRLFPIEQFSCQKYPDSKDHGANMAPTWGRQDPGGPHVGPMNLAIRDIQVMRIWFTPKGKTHR